MAEGLYDSVFRPESWVFQLCDAERRRISRLRGFHPITHESVWFGQRDPFAAKRIQALLDDL
jgi:hypothetical protein